MTAEQPQEAKAFHVPSDLAAREDLTVAQIRVLVATRTRRKQLEARLAALPAKRKALQAEVAGTHSREAELLGEEVDS